MRVHCVCVRVCVRARAYVYGLRIVSTHKILREGEREIWGGGGGGGGGGSSDLMQLYS